LIFPILRFDIFWLSFKDRLKDLIHNKRHIIEKSRNIIYYISRASEYKTGIGGCLDLWHRNTSRRKIRTGAATIIPIVIFQVGTWISRCNLSSVWIEISGKAIVIVRIPVWIRSIMRLDIGTVLAVIPPYSNGSI